MTKYVKISKVASMFSVSPRTVRRWCQQGRFVGAIKSDIDAGNWLIPISAIETFILESKGIDHGRSLHA